VLAFPTAVTTVRQALASVRPDKMTKTARAVPAARPGSLAMPWAWFGRNDVIQPAEEALRPPRAPFGVGLGVRAPLPRRTCLAATVSAAGLRAPVAPVQTEKFRLRESYNLGTDITKPHAEKGQRSLYTR
jgi:hypothetical protein